MDELRAAKARSRLIAAVVGSDDPPKWLTDALDEYAAAVIGSVTRKPEGARIQLIDRVALRHEIGEYGVHRRAEGDTELVLRLIDRAPVVVDDVSARALAASATDEGPYTGPERRVGPQFPIPFLDRRANPGYGSHVRPAEAPALCSGCGHEAHDDECIAAPVGEGEPCGCEYRPAAAPALDVERKVAAILRDYFTDTDADWRQRCAEVITEAILARRSSKEPTE